MENIEKNEKNRKISLIVISIIILLQSLFLSYYFIFEKKNYHSDEMWSYGFANSVEQGSALTGESAMNTENCEKWMDGSLLKNYITVQRGQRFRYDAVWRNMDNDIHAPLYYAFLHTICSFFPDTFSRYFAFAINLVTMIIGQIYLYRASLRISKSEFLSICICGLWGFCTGFINTYVFLRPYSLMNMLMMMLIYYNTLIYNGEGKLKTNLIKLCAVTFLGALTHHYFLVDAFSVTFFLCVYYLCTKKIKLMFSYGLTMLGSVLLSVAAFPTTINHLFFHENAQRLSAKMPFLHGLKVSLVLILNSVTGLYASVYLTNSYSYVLTVIVLLLAVGLPLAFLFRNETWFKDFLKKAGNGIVNFVKNIDYMYLCMIFCIVFMAAAVALSVNINTMEMFTDRYLFSVMPVFAIVLVMTLKYVLGLIKPIKKAIPPIIAVLCCGAVISSGFGADKRYLYNKTKFIGERISDTCTENSRYVMLLSEYWRIVCYPDKLCNCDSFIMSTPFSYDVNPEINSGNICDDLYVVIETGKIIDYEIKQLHDEEEDFEINGIVIDYDKQDYEDLPTEPKIIEKFETDIYNGYKLQFIGSENIMGSYTHTYKVVKAEDYVYVPIPDEFGIRDKNKQTDSD